MVYGSKCVFIERRGYIEQVQDISLSPKSLEVAVKNIARRLGDDISEEKPILDSRLPDRGRVAAVIAPCSLNGGVLTIRRFKAHNCGIADVISIRTITSQVGETSGTTDISRQHNI